MCAHSHKRYGWIVGTAITSGNLHIAVSMQRIMGQSCTTSICILGQELDIVLVIVSQATNSTLVFFRLVSELKSS